MALNTENDLIPFHSSPLPNGPWLIFAPHPDDETFGMGGSILLASQEQIETHVVIMTDGALGSKEEKEELVSLRKKETQTACNFAKTASLSFLEEPDRGLHHTEALEVKIMKLIGEISPKSIFFPFPFEPHPDHRITTHLIWAVLKKCSDFTGDAYAYDISVQGQINYLIDITKVKSAKRKMMSFYKSQLNENSYIEVVEALDRARTYTLRQEVSAAEGFFKYPNVSGNLSDHIFEQIQKFWSGTNESFQNSNDEQIQKLEQELQIIKSSSKARQQELEEQYEAILNSTSWKITKPVRRLKKIFTVIK